MYGVTTVSAFRDPRGTDHFASLPTVAQEFQTVNYWQYKAREMLGRKKRTESNTRLKESVVGNVGEIVKLSYK